MNSKRSYLENLNTGRERRPASALDEITRTLNQLESRLERALEPRPSEEEDKDIVRRIERLSDQAGMRKAAGHTESRPEPSPRMKLERIARQFETTRRWEDQLASIGSIAAELKALRDDIRVSPGAMLRTELNALREEIGRITAALPRAAMPAAVSGEFERLSNAVERLAERGGDQNTKLLRLELEQVKAALAKLAREDTVRSLESRLSAQQGIPDPAVERLAARLEEIAAAVNNLPESLSLNSLEEQVGALASALDRFAGQQERSQPDLVAMVEERLDEITRAVTASAALAHSPNFDPALLGRIEARVVSLARQLEEVAQDRSGGLVAERLNALSERIDQIAGRLDVPEKAVERLAKHMARLAEKFDSAAHPQQTEEFFQHFENRLADLSEAMARRQEDAIQEGRHLFQEMEQRIEAAAESLNRAGARHGGPGIMAAIDSRFAELASRFDGSRPETDGTALQALEARLDDISDRLQSSTSANAGIDADVIRNLESQVAALAAHLAKPTADIPDFEDIAPRLERLERAIEENRTVVIEAARRAANEAVQGMAAPDPIDGALRRELKNLEALTRKSDERNTKTFEAIHDTLLKIVERLGSLEEVGGKAASEAVSGLDYSFGDPAEVASPPRRAPAEAASIAADAALSDESGDATYPERRRLLRGLSRALSARSKTTVAPREEPILSSLDEENDPLLSKEHMNEPLEPGSGAPDINAIMRRVRERQGVREHAAEETAKADFIAAARRAAQAAAAEAEFSNSDAAEPTSQTEGRAGRILRRRKKQLLLTMAAAVLVAGGVHFGPSFLDRAEELAFLSDGKAPAQSKQATPAQPGEKVSLASTPKAPATQPARSASTRPPAKTVDTSRATAQAAVQQDPVGPASAGPDRPAAPKPSAEQSPAAMPAPLATSPQPLQISALQNQQAPALNHTSSPGQPAPLPPARPVPEVPADIQPAALREAAAQGNAGALYEIASRYAEGRGVAVDKAKAAQWYEAAAERGLAPAQYHLGNLYERGIGVERDLAKAKLWYHRAAGQGNASAMHNLGVLDAMGADGPADNASAARWFREAAELGVMDSQFNLGILAAKGVGIPRDLAEAYKWFDIVARTGDQDAAAKRDEIASAMAPAELAKAQEKAKGWSAREASPAANVVQLPPEWAGAGAEITASVDMKRAVTNIQLILNKIGFEAGPADGQMGERTRSAIRSFQKKNGMAETGEIDDALVRALLKRNETTQ